MKDQRSAHIIKVSFRDFYEACYAPRFKSIDLLLKTMEMPLTVEEAAEALCLSEDEIHGIMERERIAAIDRPALLGIMSRGENGLCTCRPRRRTGAFLFGQPTSRFLSAVSVFPPGKSSPVLTHLPYPP